MDRIGLPQLKDPNLQDNLADYMIHPKQYTWDREHNHMGETCLRL
jgi:hypothetical protein